MSFVWTLLYKFALGVTFPVLAVGLIVASYFAIVKVRGAALDPLNSVLQSAVIAGGLLSVVAIYFASKVVPPMVLFYGGCATAVIALGSIALDHARVMRLQKAAEKALDNAEEARRLTEEGDVKTADEMLQEALLTTEIAYGSVHPQIATIVFYMAELMKATSRKEAASVLYKRAVDVRTALQESNKSYIYAMQACADHLRETGDYDGAKSMGNRALTESKKLPNSNALSGRCALTLSRIHTSQDNLQEAYDSARTAAELLEKSQGRSHADTLQAKALLASHSVALGRVAEGERLLSEILTEKERVGETDDEVYLDLLLDQCIVYSKGKPEQARDSLLRATRLYRRKIGRDYHRSDEILERLPAFLAHGTLPDFQAFYSALFNKETRQASSFLEQNEALATTPDASGWTALQWAVFFDSAEITRVALSKGADIEAGKASDMPPLVIGTRWACRAALQTLFRKDPDIEIESDDGMRPIHAAVLSGDQLTLDQVISKKATLDVADKRGWTPLHLVACSGDRKFLLQLIPKGLDVNFQAPSTMQTPLHAAVLGGQRGAAETLLLNMAQVDLKDAEGMTPIEFAEKKGRNQMVDLMRVYVDNKEQDVVIHEAEVEK